MQKNNANKKIYQKIKPFMDAYGLQPESFEIKGGQIKFKKTEQHNRSISNSSYTKSIKKTSPQKIKPIQLFETVSPQQSLTQKYQDLFNSIQEQPLDEKRQPAIIEVPESDESEHPSVKNRLKQDIIELDKIKQKRLEELHILEEQIKEIKIQMEEVQSIQKKQEIQIIDKEDNQNQNQSQQQSPILIKQTLRQIKDKAATIIQAYIKGRQMRKRFLEWKQKKLIKLNKIIFIQKWWKGVLKRKKIEKKFEISHQLSQMRMIDTHSFIIHTNYSYILQRIRIIIIERQGIIRNNIRFYLNLQNIKNILKEENIEDDISTSFEFNYLIDILINNLLRIFIIKDDKLIITQDQLIFEMDRLHLFLKMILTIQAENKYSIILVEEIQNVEENNNQDTQLYEQNENIQEINNNQQQSQNIQDNKSNFLEQQQIPQVIEILDTFELPQIGQDQLMIFKSQGSIIQSEDLRKDTMLLSKDISKDFLPPPTNLKSIQEIQDQKSPISDFQTPQIIQSELRKSNTDEGLRQSLGTTFKFTFSSEFRTSSSGIFLSQPFKMKQQDSLQYSMDGSQEIRPIYITTVEEEIDVYQLNDKLLFQHKEGIYKPFQYQIQTIQQSETEYINNHLYVYVIMDRIICCEAQKIIKIQKIIKQYRFQRSILTFFTDQQQYLIILFKSFLNTKILIYKNLDTIFKLYQDIYLKGHYKNLKKNFPQVAACFFQSKEYMLSLNQALN